MTTHYYGMRQHTFTAIATGAAFIAGIVIGMWSTSCRADGATHYELRCTNGSVTMSESAILLAERTDGADEVGYCPPSKCDMYVTAGPAIDGSVDSHGFLTWHVNPVYGGSLDYIVGVWRSVATCRISYRSGSALEAAGKEPRIKRVD